MSGVYWCVLVIGAGRCSADGHGKDKKRWPAVFGDSDEGETNRLRHDTSEKEQHLESHIFHFVCRAARSQRSRLHKLTLSAV